MKILLASALMALAPALVLAQAQPAAKTPAAPAKTAAKNTAKAAPKTSAAKSRTSGTTKADGADKKVVAKAKSKATSSRTQLKSATNQIATGMIAAEAALSPEELAIAERVHVGHIGCELGASVDVVADAQSPGRFHIGGKGFKYHMSPVATSTGAVRLEDQKAGAVWLQIANKSMLMDQKRGQRLADECMSPAQVQVAEAIKKNPLPSVLEPMPPAAR